ncbi:MAG TPA: LamG domain-containing protein, partial [Thermoplasmatales archaeon]|nr:LamG domain-containing protein [Thermoplasmatales archaeon]
MLQKTLVVLFVATLFFGAGVTPINVAGSSEQKSENDMGRDAGSLNDGLVAYWKLDEGNGNIIHDCSGNSNDGTIHGPKWRQGIHNYSLEFDGINDYAIVPDDPTLNFHKTNKFSISLWIKREGVLITHDEVLVSKGTHAYKKGYGVNIKRKNNTIEFYVKGGGKEFTCYSSIDLYDNLWYYVTAVWDGHAQRIYINGELNNFKNLSDFTIDDDHKA